MRTALAAVIGMLALALTAVAPAGAAVIEPTKFADESGNDPANGTCTLREAVRAAEIDAPVDACPAGSGRDVIRLRNGTYTITVPGGDGGNGSREFDWRFDDLDFETDVEILGHRKGSTIDGGNARRLIDVFANTLILRRVTLTKAAPTYNYGGALRVSRTGVPEAHVKLIRSAITESKAAPTLGAGAASVAGAGSKLTLIRSKIVDNTGPGTAGVEASSGGILIVSRSTISRNKSTEAGPGALFVFGSAEARISDSQVSRNEGNGPAAAGGINLGSAKLVVQRTVVSKNDGEGDGGGIGVLGGDMTIRDSEISENRADRDGGGLSSSNTPKLLIVNTTFSGNLADADGTGPNAGDGGGAFLSTDGSQTTVRNSTFVNNTADRGGGIYGRHIAGNAPTIIGSLSSNNTATAEPNSADCRGYINSGGHNLFSTVFLGINGCQTPVVASDRMNVPGKVKGLADNGGPTRTHALRGASQAVNNGPPSAPKSDQRGAPRKNADIGAYELRSCKGVVVNRVGTSGRDILNGTAKADGFLALGGNDKLRGKGGGDGMCGGGGKDKLFGDGGNDKLSGQGGSGDLCDGGSGSDSADGSCERRRSIP